MSDNHWMLFSTFAEQDYYEYPARGTYKGVVINGNMAAYAPAGIAAFLAEKTASTTTYLIDPLTHAFQHDPSVVLNSEGTLKLSMRKLADHYGPPVSDLVGKQSLLPEKLSDTKVFHTFVENCVDFQLNLLAMEMRNSNAAKYMDDIDNEVSPYAVVAPYFYLSEASFELWLPINVAATRKTLEVLEKNQKCFVAIVISKGVLIDDHRQRDLVAQFKNLPISGFLVWIDSFDEQSASQVELTRFIELCKALRDNNQREVINLHGGYFSVLACSKLGEHALTGVAHGPEFGEYRPVIPVGGGIPLSKYYVPTLHARVRYLDAVRIFVDKDWLTSVPNFLANVCDCEVCRETLATDIDNFDRFGDSITKTIRRRNGIVRIGFPTTEARLLCLKHYLQCKKREYEGISSATPQELSAKLDENIMTLRDVVGHEGVSHMLLWKRSFEHT